VGEGAEKGKGLSVGGANLQENKGSKDPLQ